MSEGSQVTRVHYCEILSSRSVTAATSGHATFLSVVCCFQRSRDSDCWNKTRAPLQTQCWSKNEDCSQPSLLLRQRAEAGYLGGRWACLEGSQPKIRQAPLVRLPGKGGRWEWSKSLNARQEAERGDAPTTGFIINPLVRTGF